MKDHVMAMYTIKKLSYRKSIAILWYDYCATPLLKLKQLVTRYYIIYFNYTIALGAKAKNCASDVGTYAMNNT